MNKPYPHVVVAAVVERNGEYLFVEESINGQLRINQPAGHWEIGESLTQAMIRETLEESAWEVEPTGFLGVYHWQADTLDYPFLRVTFTARPLREHVGRPLDKGIQRALWLTPQQLRDRSVAHRSPSVLKCVEDHLAGRQQPLNLVQDLGGGDW